MATYYRGENSLTPRKFELRFDKATGLVKPERGVSVSTRPDGLDRFGGAHALGQLPPELQVVQTGNDPHHHEVIPVAPMTQDRYEELLAQIPLTPV